MNVTVREPKLTSWRLTLWLLEATGFECFLEFGDNLRVFLVGADFFREPLGLIGVLIFSVDSRHH